MITCVSSRSSSSSCDSLPAVYVDEDSTQETPVAKAKPKPKKKSPAQPKAKSPKQTVKIPNKKPEPKSKSKPATKLQPKPKTTPVGGKKPIAPPKKEQSSASASGLAKGIEIRRSENGAGISLFFH